jgi:hypothetical protein
LIEHAARLFCQTLGLGTGEMIPHFYCHARELVHRAEGPEDKGDHHKEWDWQKMSTENKNLQGQPANCGPT